MKNLFILFCPVILLLTNCSKKEDVTPAPPAAALATAAFTIAHPVAEVGEQVALTNTSQNAVRYEWRSSDQPTALNIATNATFTSTVPGTYTITLTAYNTDNKASTSSQTIRIGRRYLTEIRVNSLNFLNPNNQPWDGGSGPDVLFHLNYQNTTIANGGIILNVTNAVLPLRWNMSSRNIEAKNDGWLLTFLEGNNFLGDVTMLTNQFSEVTPPLNRDALGAGSTSWRSPDNAWNFTLSYETR